MTPGEAWTRDVLRDLRAGGYRLGAWQRFLARSFERANATRRVRRREHHQVLLAGVAGLAVWVAVAAFRPWLALAGAFWWLLVVAMLDWHLGMLENDWGRPLCRLGLPNLLSLARAAVVPVLPFAVPALLSAILIPAGLTDAIDGRLARRRGEETRLGRWLDGAADTLALSAASVGAARHGLLPWWAVTLVLARQALPWLAVSLAYFGPGRGALPWRRRLWQGNGCGALRRSRARFASAPRRGAAGRPGRSRWHRDLRRDDRACLQVATGRLTDPRCRWTGTIAGDFHADRRVPASLHERSQEALREACFRRFDSPSSSFVLTAARASVFRGAV